MFRKLLNLPRIGNIQLSFTSTDSLSFLITNNHSAASVIIMSSAYSIKLELWVSLSSDRLELRLGKADKDKRPQN